MATTVRELIELLRDYPANAPVAIAKDAAGGAYAPFEEITEEDLDLGELRDNFDYETDEGDGADEENEISTVVLWPAR